MDIFVARQPILTKEENVIGYELLYRNSEQNYFSEIDGDVATTDVLLNSFLGIGNEQLSSGKKLFINFTRNLLLKKVPTLFSPEKIIIEVLEDIEGDEEIIAKIAELKKLGYTIALDDYLLKESNINLLPYADIIKIDFLTTTKKQRQSIGKIAKLYKAKLLAEKIETREDFEVALEEGFEYFQGYFFSKPMVVSTTDIPFQAYGHFKILKELNKPEPDIDKIVSLIEYDLSLSYKILKIVNTLAYYTKVKITSIKQAIIILGLNELVRWFTIISLKEQQSKTPLAKEILAQSLIRGKFAEQFGSKLFGDRRKAECFMLGMFSLLDAILQRPMENVLETLPLSDAVKNALVKETSELRVIIEVIEAIEKADWEKLNAHLEGSSPTEIASYYEKSISWTNEIIDNLNE
ncbi:EAL domain-containing protein [Anaerobacillus sp. CMMVII]|uniref:EAL and HDOD domain-containing protein n=1 Tax=Anaerobacillus sp. CMMVII TaxID=2755588 RepID=UPI0021B74F76|nr:HDOD domain-containing protein [Anaerobacillus sp. CMMVII]MCT8140463.1 EAL domain-containing protein [Anaerobacillus sp. CMMVII]